MSFIFALSMLAQAAFMPPASPPPPAGPGTEAFKNSQLTFEQNLRRSCLSEAGIRMAVEDWTQRQARLANRSDSTWPLEHEIAEAAYATPVDVDRFERAMRAKAAAQARREEANLEESVQFLRRLSLSDRAIYARRFTLVQPTIPARTCKAD